MPNTCEDANGAEKSGSSPAKRGRGTPPVNRAYKIPKLPLTRFTGGVEGAVAFAPLPAFGGTPPAAQGESQSLCGSAPPREIILSERR